MLEGLRKPYAVRIATGYEIIRGKHFSRSGENSDFYLESGKTGIIKKSQGKLK